MSFSTHTPWVRQAGVADRVQARLFFGLRGSAGVVSRHRIAAIVETYKGRYRQESVMVARSRLEVCF